MNWKILSILTIAMPLNMTLGQTDTAAIAGRLSEEKLKEYLSKIGQKQFAEVFQDFKDTSPHSDASRAEYLLDLGNLLIRVSESARVQGDKANAFDFSEHGASELKAWMNGRVSRLSSDDRLRTRALMGKTMERLLRDGDQAIDFYEAAVKEFAPSDWQFESVEQLELLRARASARGAGLSKEAAHSFDRLIFLKREKRIIDERIAAAAALRQRQAQAGGN